eukprot:1377027-Amphidinium_carterae.1
MLCSAAKRKHHRTSLQPKWPLQSMLGALIDVQAGMHEKLPKISFAEAFKLKLQVSEAVSVVGGVSLCNLCHDCCCCWD